MSGAEHSDLECPKCHRTSSRVVDSRGNTLGYIRRRRECLYCRYRYSTREVLAHKAVLPFEVDQRLEQLQISIVRLREAIQLATCSIPEDVDIVDVVPPQR